LSALLHGNSIFSIRIREEWVKGTEIDREEYVKGTEKGGEKLAYE
jgi:hypothetical protein